DNRVMENDFSHAVANGIEATFSRGNRFARNVLHECEHGVWAGYSYETAVYRNEIERCANGVSIEHGHGNRLAWNKIRSCPTGVHLWWDEDADLARSAFATRHDLRSRANSIEENEFEQNGVDVLLENDQSTTVRR